MKIALRPLHGPDEIPFQSFTLRDGDDPDHVVGLLVAEPEAVERISSALRGSEGVSLLSPRGAEPHSTVGGYPSGDKLVSELAPPPSGPAPGMTPNVSETPNVASATVDKHTLLWRLHYAEFPFDPLRMERAFRAKARDFLDRDPRYAVHQSGIADEWRDIYERAVAAGIELRGESAPKVERVS